MVLEVFQVAAVISLEVLDAWQEVLEGRLEPLSALMLGLLELKKGTIAALAPYAQAAQELVKVAREVA